ncbi:MAG TPA: BrnT family toxin [Armatimonadota bacterium]|nr:BrnT family toxin [Armatimonadota bacterium]
MSCRSVARVDTLSAVRSVIALEESADPMEFEWDRGKEVRNRARHGVDFTEAATVFGDPLANTFYDPDHSHNEHRFLTFGRGTKGRLLVVCHTDRRDRTRIIGARVATRRESKIYEQG